MELASYIDHTLLKPDISNKQVVSLCNQAVKYDFAAVCIHPYFVPLCKRMLKPERIAVCTVIGFPFGTCYTSVKAFEAERVLNDGASEIDMVMNISAFYDNNYKYVLDDIKTVKNVCGEFILKVIIESAYLKDKEKINACNICRDAGADFVKTSTGFGPSGATIEDVKLIKNTLGNSLKIKAAGGITTRTFAEELIRAGADRLGTSSAIALMES